MNNPITADDINDYLLHELNPDEIIEDYKVVEDTFKIEKMKVGEENCEEGEVMEEVESKETESVEIETKPIFKLIRDQ